MWKLPLFEVRASATEDTDTHIMGVYQESEKKVISPKKAYSDLLERLHRDEVFTGASGTLQFIRTGAPKGPGNLLWVGLGRLQDASQESSLEKLRILGGTAWSRLAAEKSKVAAISVESFLGGSAKGGTKKIDGVRAFAEGLILGAYQFQKYKSTSSGSDVGSKKSSPKALKGPTHLLFVCEDAHIRTQLQEKLAEVHASAEAIRITRDWSNEPSNIGTPLFYATEAKKLASEYGLKCRILTEKDAQREKMGLYLGVGQGAEKEGRIVILEYVPKGVKNPKTVALVGKGITFDSGGISIKPALRMEEMKHDMTGAATVMGAIALASRWKVKNRIIALMAFTENMPDGNAIQPGNILTARNGKTVEVINTDAEGRLILADALDFVQDMKPDAVVNIATLTGAVSIALGKLCCAVLGNDQALIDEIREAGSKNGERMWQLPLFDDYFEDMKSDYADMKNSANDGNGGTIRGAIFLKQFIRKGTRWAHLDIASTAYGISHLSYVPKKGASGLYVRTLAQFAADFK